MSSKYVRDEFRSSWVTEVPTIPLYETLNDDPDHSTMPDLWASVEFQAFNEERISFGSPSCWEERGTITISIAVKAGTGDASLLTACETVRDAYRSWEVDNLEIVQVDPPISDSGYSEGLWYYMDVDISYVYENYV